MAHEWYYLEPSPSHGSDSKGGSARTWRNSASTSPSWLALPSTDKWKGFKATRVFRGVRYAIELKRQGKGNEVALTIDGKAVAGSVVSLPAAGTTEVKVEVLLGA